MEDRESSTASSVDFYDSDKKPDSSHLELEPVPSDSGATKRKAEDPLPVEEKKPRLDSSSLISCDLKPCAGLPPAVWQHVFLSCSLHDLGRLLQVNRSFHSYLTDVSSVSSSDPTSGSLHLLKSDSIWASARNSLPVKPPKPPQGFSELQLWQLAWSKRCQFCGKESSAAPGDKVWQKGPGAYGVRTIWSFGIKSCGKCLMEQCQTDASLLFSSASALRPALPFALITSDQHYVPAYTLQSATTPAGIEISKYYYKKHVEAITEELNDALSLGSAAAQEWSKGLEDRGIERMKVVEQWERWEVKYQWWAAHNDPKRMATAAPDVPSADATTLQKEKSKSPVRKVLSPVILSPVPTGTLFSASNFTKDGSLFQRFNDTPNPYLTAAATPSRFVPSRPPTVPHQYTPQPGNNGGAPVQRNLHDANETKASRKADIERRCQDINPPIPPNVLRHMDSFKAALQISQPMTEHAWSVLQPRLLAQLPAAQQAEADHVARNASVSKLPERRPPEINSKEAKEAMDREWEIGQQPIRDKLGAIADCYIDRNWDHGRAVTYENSPKFAVDLLVNVRRNYYSNADISENAADWNTASASEMPSGSTKPKLVLDNMKWVYDNKVKPLTEQYRKEIFLCNGCEGNFKYYGFEGVIQHFGAKHTNAFSVGNIVVHWREAEWPAETPFHPDPTSVKHAYHATPSTSGHAGYGAYYGGYSRAGTSTPHTQSHLPQASPGPYHHYAGHYNGPFAPPQIHPPVTPGYEYKNQPYGVSMDSYPFQSMAPPQGFGSQPNYGPQPGNGYMASPAMSNPAMASLSTSQRQVPGADDTHLRSEERDHRTSLFDKQVSTIIGVAQDVWKQTSGIKDFPNNLRIYVLLQRVISKFHLEFNHEPNLSHFIDAFSNYEIPRALKQASGLSCKTCQEGPSHHRSGQEERKTYTASTLFSHFKSHHLDVQIAPYANGQPRNPLDWKEDMIELPSDRFISGLIHAPGMDDEKLHMIATTFPTLFPTPLPKIGSVEEHDVALSEKGLSKDTKSNSKGDKSGVPSEKSGPSSLASPYTGSPQPAKPTATGYPQQRSSLPGLGSEPAGHTDRKGPSRGSPPSDERRNRYHTESFYYLPREHQDREYYYAEEPLEHQANYRRLREPRPYIGGFRERQPLYRDQEAYYHPEEEQGLAYPRNGAYVPDYVPPSRQARYSEATSYYAPEPRFIREPRAQDVNPSEENVVAGQFLEDFLPSRPPTNEHLDVRDKPMAEPDHDDGPRYSPPPVNASTVAGATDQHRFGDAAQPPLPSAVSNGSRFEEPRPARRPIRTPDSARGSRRPGPHRPGQRHGHAPSRYYRYMSVARDEPYSRGASISRSQSKRYEEQRRRIDEQETPQPTADREQPFSRDHSLERVPVDDPSYQGRPMSREYVSVQDRRHPLSSPRYHYSRYPEESRGSAVYVQDHGYPIQEYEIVRIPREAHSTRGAYGPRSPTRYMEHEPENIRYVPVPYDHPYPERYDSGPQPVYHDERERHLPARKPTYASEATYEPPMPEIKVEAIAPVTEAP
ncbi:hypothetical protein DM02DRAFT_726301 [Periconia macrospinosa]|uniref:DUF7892 domain-containing protein n=1 Tax=Periconia macrospinosa TaxID=97972 RepID=A0A2V1DZE1_9PLEO|nr:hypothetical protein DM02DRAFT_726301 [Periconia macrospinosa]